MKSLPLLLSLATLALATPASAAGDVLAPRFKQTRARIETLFGHRTVDAGNEPIKENPFRVGGITPEGAPAPIADSKPGQVAITGDAELLAAGALALKPSLRGTITRTEGGGATGTVVPYVTIDITNYPVGATVGAKLSNGQTVYLRILEIIPSTSATQRGSVKFGYKDLSVTATF